MSRTKKWQHVTARFECFDKDGNLKWQEDVKQNTWHDEGEMYIGSAVFATGYTGYGAPVANYYLGLDARASLADTDTLATLTGEPSGNGYARQALSTAGTGAGGQDFVLATPAGTITTKTVTFTCATSAWGAVTKAFLCTHITAVTSAANQRLLCSLALSASRTLQVGDSLNCSMVITISE